MLRTFLCSGLLSSAAEIHVVKALPQTLAAFEPGLSARLERFRRLVQGESVDLPTIVAFDGITVGEGTAVPTPSGTLREPPKWERATFPFGVSPTAVVERWLPITFNIAEAAPETISTRPEVIDHQKLIGRGAKLLPLSALLAVERTEHERSEYIAPGFVWEKTLIPGAVAGSFSGRARQVIETPVPFPSPIGRFGGNALTLRAGTSIYSTTTSRHQNRSPLAMRMT
jgi:hypothetical protein